MRRQVLTRAAATPMGKRSARGAGDPSLPFHRGLFTARSGPPCSIEEDESRLFRKGASECPLGSFFQNEFLLCQHQAPSSATLDRVAQFDREDRMPSQRSTSSPTEGLTVAVVGGGNGGHVLAGLLAPVCKLNVLTRRPEAWSATGVKVSFDSSAPSYSSISLDDDGRRTSSDEDDASDGECSSIAAVERGAAATPARPAKISSDAADVIPDADIVVVGGPVHITGTLLARVAPFLKRGAMIGTLFGQGGFDWMARDQLAAAGKGDVTVFALQNIPWICRIAEYGAHVRVLGVKKVLNAAVHRVAPIEKGDVQRAPATAQAIARIRDIFFIDVRLVPFLAITLTPSNQILHPARYHALFAQGKKVRTYGVKEFKQAGGDKMYETFCQQSADNLADLDSELQAIKHAIARLRPDVNLDTVVPFAERVATQYGPQVTDTSTVRSTVSTNRGYAGIDTPVKVDDGRVEPDRASRIFHDDIPFGLCVLKDLGQLMDVETPTCDRIITWAQDVMGTTFLDEASGRLKEETLHMTGAPARFGIRTAADL